MLTLKKVSSIVLVSDQELLRYVNAVFCLLRILSYVGWGVMKGVGSSIGRGRNGASIMQDGEVDLQHETGTEESSHPCIKGHHSKKAFLYLETHMFKSLYIAPLPPVQTLNTSHCTPYS
jgi:hypothetical protein